jgi:NAD(P)-dependent dehydrogenase (short-subunit alcohol dehydrogenase family)
MDVSNLTGKNALVTGGASGIGKETALALARAGADLFLCDLDEEALKSTEEQIQALGRRVVTRRTDVSNAGEMSALADAVHGEIEALDILVNNAGVGVAAEPTETSLDDWNWIVGINLMGVVHGCHFFIPRMVERGRGGHVVNIASMASYLAVPTLGAYNATKSAVVGLSESYRAELARHGIGVTAICPGLINTPIVRHMRYRGMSAVEEAKGEMKQAMERRNYGPERVAKNILKAIQRNRAIAPVAAEAWIFYYLKRLFPGFVRWTIQQVADRQRSRLTAGPDR